MKKAHLDLRTDLHRVLTNERSNTRELARILHAVRYNDVGGVPIWKVWGFKSWYDFVEEDTGMHVNRADDHVVIWDRLGPGGYNLLHTFGGHLSYTKLRIIAKSTVAMHTKQEARRWMRRAVTLTCCRLEHELAGDMDDVQTLNVHLKTRDADFVKRVLDNAKEKFNTNNRGEALNAVVREWAKAQKPTLVKTRKEVRKRA